MRFLEIVEYIKSDLHRYGGAVSLSQFVEHIIFSRGFRFSFWFRLCKSRRFLLKSIAKLFRFRLSRRYGIDFPTQIEVGYGLYLGHGIGIVVNPSTKIGNNCNLSQFTTIGANKGGQAAIIGDNVYIGPNVCIVEAVVIGDNSTIGAGSVVTKDVAPNLTVAGVPAKPISEKNPGQFVNRRWDVTVAIANHENLRVA